MFKGFEVESSNSIQIQILFSSNSAHLNPVQSCSEIQFNFNPVQFNFSSSSVQIQFKLKGEL